MQITEYKTTGCCGKDSIFYKLDRPIDINLSNKFIELGLLQADHLAKAGVMYLYNNEYILSGPFGSNKLQFKCKLKDCVLKKAELESILKSF